MKKIKTEDIVDGMVVVKLIEDRLGRSILKPGDQLKASFSPRLVKWGVEEIWVESSDEEGATDEPSEADVQEREMASANNLLKIKFQKFDDESHMNIVKKITQHYLRDPRLKKYSR